MRRGGRFRASAVALALTGCASTGPAVQVPAPVACVVAADIPREPQWLSDGLPADASAAETVRALGTDLVTAAQYGAVLRVLVEACADGAETD